MGKLSVVGTPIGNLGDITYRALETLGNADLILAEDSRHTKRLLNHYHITTLVTSYHAHSTDKKLGEVLAKLKDGQNLALVTDAGTPAISDPGSRLVTAAREAGHEVVTIPGPAAVTAALSIAGMGDDSFTFIGFLPHKKGRQTKLKTFPGLPQPIVLYEAPTRLVKLLGQLEEMYPNADVRVARELTKQHEELRMGTPSELKAHYESKPPKGEVVVLVGI